MNQYVRKIFLVSLIGLPVILAGYDETCATNATLSRKKRFLIFPDKSNFVMTITLRKPTWYQLADFRQLNTIHEMDYPIPIPKKFPEVFFSPNNHFYNYHGRQDRAILYSHIESFLQLFGWNGRACIQKFLCQMKKVNSKHWKKSLLFEIFHKFFQFPAGSDGEFKEYEVKEKHCHSKCSFHILDRFLKNGKHQV